MNFIKRVNGSWVDIPHYVHNTSTDTLTTLPAVLYTNAATATVGLKGQTLQSSVPSPDNPIMPNGTGERTGNLFDLNRSYSSSFTTDVSKWMNGATTTNNTGGGYAESVIGDDSVTVTSKVAGYGASFLIDVSPNTTYTISFETDKTSSGSFAGFSERDNEGNVLRNGVMQSNSTTITTGQNCVFLNLCFRFPSADGQVKFSKLMLNTGSTALPYEPYGIKIPISSGGVNLFDKTANYDVGGTTYNYTISGLDPDKYYTCSTNFERIRGVDTASLYFNGGISLNNGVWSDTPRTFRPNYNGEIVVYIRYKVDAGAPAICDDVMAGTIWVMVNEGSTALPYEPYVQPTETNIYLGEVESTRRIRKLVLDGTENWVSKGNPATFRYENSPIASDLNLVCYCSHFKNLPWQQIATTNNSFSVMYTSQPNTINIRCDDYSTVEDFKFYLAQQYAAGTPVCVWYVLATPQTAVVNEPLMKIGDYADEVSNVSIPVTAGANTLSVDTTVQPSEVTATYKGWHPIQSVHERENGQWD